MLVWGPSAPKTIQETLITIGAQANGLSTDVRGVVPLEKSNERSVKEEQACCEAATNDCGWKMLTADS